MVGEPFEVYLRDHVMQPAGMTSARTVDYDDQSVPGLGDGHVVAYGRAFAVDGPHAFEAGAGGVVASAADMAQWLIVQTNHGRAADGTPVISDDSLAEQHTPGTGTHGYALGWDTDGPAEAPTRLEHTGSLLTWSSYMEVVPDSGYGVVLLINSGSGLLLDQTGIFHGVRDIIEGTDLTPAGPAAARVNATTFDWVLGLLTLAVLLLGVRGVIRAREWARACLPIPAGASAAQHARWRRCRRSKDAQSVSAPAACHRTPWTTPASTVNWETRPRRRRRQSWIVAGAPTATQLALLAALARFPHLVQSLLSRDVTWESAAYGWPALTVLIGTMFLATSATLVARAWQLARGRTSLTTRARSRSGLDEPGLVGDDDQLRPIADAELGHRVTDVGAGGGGTEVELGADLVVAEPAPDQGEHLPLALGEYGEQRVCVATRGATRGDLGDQAAGDARCEQRLAGRDHADRVQ
jgi:hypothetical protein